MLKGGDVKQCSKCDAPLPSPHLGKEEGERCFWCSDEYGEKEEKCRIAVYDTIYLGVADLTVDHNTTEPVVALRSGWPQEPIVSVFVGERKVASYRIHLEPVAC